MVASGLAALVLGGTIPGRAAFRGGLDPAAKTPPRALLASGVLSGDSDGDGLVDSQESVIGTATDNADTDGDGFTDLEEVSRQTDPLSASSVPSAASPQVGMVGRVQGGILTLVTALYVPAGELSSTGLELGLALGGVATPLRASAYLSASTVAFAPASTPGDQILVLETQAPESFVHSLGSVAAYAKATDPAGVQSAGVLQMESVPGTDALGNPLPVVVRVEAAPSSLLSPFTGTGASGGRDWIFRPLVADENIPTDWTPGEVCFQQMAPIGANGVNLVFEVTSASCQPMDTYCASSACSAAVGTEIEIVDPGAIIGG